MYTVVESSPLPNGRALWVLDLKGASVFTVHHLQVDLLHIVLKYNSRQVVESRYLASEIDILPFRLRFKVCY